MNNAYKYLPAKMAHATRHYIASPIRLANHLKVKKSRWLRTPLGLPPKRKPSGGKPMPIKRTVFTH